MSEKKFGLSFEDSSLKGQFDGNKDGEPSVSLSLDVKEAFGEIFSKGEAVVDAKKVALKMEDSVLKLMVDTDQDEEPLLTLEIDLAESFDEIADAITKKKEDVAS